MVNEATEADANYIGLGREFQGFKMSQAVMRFITIHTRRQVAGDLDRRPSAGVYSYFSPGKFGDSGSTTDAAVDAIGRQVRWLVDHPEAIPFLLHLAQILGLVEHRLHALVRIGGVHVHDATGISAREDQDCRQQQ